VPKDSVPIFDLHQTAETHGVIGLAGSPTPGLPKEEKVFNLHTTGKHQPCIPQLKSVNPPPLLERRSK